MFVSHQPGIALTCSQVFNNVRVGINQPLSNASILFIYVGPEISTSRRTEIPSKDEEACACPWL